MIDEPQPTNLTGFDKTDFDDDYRFQSQRDANDLHLMNPKLLQSKYGKRTIKVEMEQEKPASETLTAMLTKFAYNLGGRLLGAVVSSIKEVPGYISSGATILISSATEKVKTLTPEVQKFDPSQESILIVMPDEVIQGGVAAQDKWLEEQRHQLDSHIHILAPIEKKIQLKNLNESSLQESILDPVQEATPQHNQFNLIGSEDLTMIPRQVLAISQQSYQRLIEYNNPDENEIKESLYQSPQIQEPEPQYDGVAIQYPTIGRAISNAIKLYPMLPTMIDKNQINFQVEQMLAEEKKQQQQQQENDVEQEEVSKQEVTPQVQVNNPYERLDNFKPEFNPIQEKQEKQKVKQQVEEYLCE